MKRIDEKQTEFITNYLNGYDWVSSAWTKTEEDFNLDCYFSTSATTYGVEIKTFQNQTLMGTDGEINDYFKVGNTTGLCRNFRYCNVPDKDDSLAEIFAEYYGTCDTTSIEDYDEDTTPCPDEFKDKKVFIVNASAISGGKEIVMSNYSKWFKLNSGHNMLIIMAQDGLFIFTEKAIKKAFLGYCRMKTKHTNNSNALIKDFNEYYELKALLDMSYGKFIPMNISKDILKNN